jgi:hypothetical protein
VTPNVVPTRAPTTIWQVVDGELVILRTDAQELMGMNESARRVWDLIDGSRDVSAIAHELADHYDEPVDRVRDDVVSFISEMAELGVLTTEPPGVAS